MKAYNSNQLDAIQAPPHDIAENNGFTYVGSFLEVLSNQM